MEINVGKTDRLIRIVIGAALIILSLTGIIGLWGWIGIVPLLSGVFARCPLYNMIGLNTHDKSKCRCASKST